MLLNTHSKAFSQQQLPRFRGDETRHMSLKKTNKQKVPPENENFKESWPAKVKHG